MGFGMVAYFRMLSSFIAVFLIFSILSIPAICIYSSHEGMVGLTNYAKARFSLGNMGFSTNICTSMFLGVGKG
jgi:hypothetical protein